MDYRITGKIGGFDVDLLAKPVGSVPDPDPGPNQDFVVFERDGIFHEATVSTPQVRIEDGITPPPGVYSEAIVEFDFFYAGLNPAAPEGRHNICWFALDGNGALLFYPLVVRNRFRVGHGVSPDTGVPKHRMETAFPAIEGWHHVWGRYGDGTVGVRLTDPSEETHGMVDTADVARLVLEPSSRFKLHFGFNGEHEPDKEPISLGWKWRDLRISYRREGG